MGPYPGYPWTERGFIPIRKPANFPAEVIEESYDEKEYGKDTGADTQRMHS